MHNSGAHFTPDDLAHNRTGRLLPQQSEDVKRLIGRERRSIVFWIILADLFLIGAFIDAYFQQLREWWEREPLIRDLPYTVYFTDMPTGIHILSWERSA